MAGFGSGRAGCTVENVDGPQPSTARKRASSARASFKEAEAVDGRFGNGRLGRMQGEARRCDVDGGPAINVQNLRQRVADAAPKLFRCVVRIELRSKMGLTQVQRRRKPGQAICEIASEGPAPARNTP